MLTKETFQPNPYFVVTGRQQSWLNDQNKVLPVSCTMIQVEDSYHDIDYDQYGYPKFDKLETIAGSWDYVSHAIKTSCGVAIDLSKIRAKGTIGSGGMVAQGVTNWMHYYSDINEDTIRGSVFKNGAVVMFLDYNHPDIFDFLNYPVSRTAWAKRAVYIDENLFIKENYPLLDRLIKELEIGNIFISKKSYDKDGERVFSQVCVTGDTWIPTSKGLRRVEELIGTPFTSIRNSLTENSKETNVLLDEKLATTLPSGFFETGKHEVFEVMTQEGYRIQITSQHKFNMFDGSTKMAKDLTAKDRIKLNNSSMTSYNWEGIGNYDEGWICGYFLANGCWATENRARFPFWYDWSIEQISKIQERLDSTLGEKLELHEREKYRTWESPKLGEFFKKWGILKDKKEISDLMMGASKQFLIGLVSGYFDGDCCITKITELVKETIQISSIKLSELEKIQIILSQFNIRSIIWKSHQTKGEKSLPMNDGTGRSRLYNCQTAHRLDISGRFQVESFMSQIGLTKLDKVETFYENRDKYQLSVYPPRDYARVQSVISMGIKHTFNCHINEPEHSFIGNGLSSKQCQEILVKSRQTCSLGHVNLGMISDENQIPMAIKNSMEDLINLWKLAKPEIQNSGYYKDPDDDPQVGLGLIGLANLLCNMGVKYLDFVLAMERLVYNLEFLEDISPQAYAIAFNLVEGYGLAMEVAKKENLVRAFTIAPTATCAFRYEDINGFTCSPEISPPIADPTTKMVERISERNGKQESDIYQYPENIEVCGVDVDWQLYDRLIKVFQTLMNDTGLSHTISYNWWLSKPVNLNTFTEWFNSELQTIYYRWEESSSVTSKVEIQIESTIEDEDFWSGEEDLENPNPNSLIKDILEEIYVLDDIKSELEQSISAVAEEQWFWGDDDTLELENLPSSLPCKVKTQKNDKNSCQTCS